MMTSSRTVLHEYKVTFLRWLMPLFFLLGCLVLSMSIGLPFLLRPAADIGLWVSIGIAFLAGLAMPIGSILMWLLIPAITTRYDPARGVVVLEYRRPLSRSVKEYHVAEIADIGLVSMSERNYSLALMLRSGKSVRIEYSSSGHVLKLEEQAAAIKAAIGVGR